MASIAHRAMTTRKRRAALRGTFLDDLVQGIRDTAEQGATSWLVQQYAVLRQLPQRLALLERKIASIRAAVHGQLNTAADPLMHEAGELAQLRAEYPAMIAAVDQAYQVTRESFKGDASAGDVAQAAVPAILTAKSFASRVQAVDDAIATVVTRLVESGTITPEQAAGIQAGKTQTPEWVPWVVGGVAVVGGVFILSRLFAKRRRA